MAKGFLRSRWLYWLLGGIVAVLYARFFFSGLPLKYLTRTEEAVEQPAPAPAPSAEVELTMPRLHEAMKRDPGGVLLLGVWMLLAMGFGVTGIGLSLRAVWTRRLQRVFRYRSKLPQVWSLGEFGRLMALLLLLASLFPFVNVGLVAWGALGLSDEHLWSLIAMFLLHGFLVLFVWGFASMKHLSLAAAFGLSRGKGMRVVRQGLLGYAVIFPWVFGLLWGLAQLCHQLGIKPPIEPIHELLLLEDHRLVVVLTIVLACVVGPVAEEILFRGILFPSVRRHTSRLVAMLVSGAVFAAAHTTLIGFLPILILGCFLADLYERTGSLVSSITVHILHNTLLVGLSLTVKTLFWNA